MKGTVVMYGCESWTMRKAEHRKIDAFEQWCWRRLLRVPWTARRFNKSILKEINPENPLEGLMLKLKLQYFGHQLTHLKRPWCQERLKEGGEGDDRGWDGCMASPTQWMCLSKLWEIMKTGKPGVLQSKGSQSIRHDWTTEQQQQLKATSCEVNDNYAEMNPKAKLGELRVAYYCPLHSRRPYW